VERENSELPLSVQAELSGISRSSLYYQGVSVLPEEIRLKHRIDQIYTAWPFYGSRKITAYLYNENVNINRKRVQRYRREMGIAGICPDPDLFRRNLAHRLYPYFWVENGATRVVPGTHRQAGLPSNYLQDLISPHPEEILLEVAAGTVILFNAHLFTSQEKKGKRHWKGLKLVRAEL